MFSKINSIYLSGTNGLPVLVEADVSDGLPGFSLVGYLTSELREAQERVRTAIRNLGLGLLPKRVTVNLSPADFKKDGTGFDLAIAAAVLAAYGKFPSSSLADAVFAGELGLDGKVKGIPGALVLADFAKKSGFGRIFLPAENVREASVVEGITLIETRTLKELCEMLTGAKPLAEYRRDPELSGKISLNEYPVDFSEVNGQPLLRRAAEVAAAGMHNLLMIGPPGSGKTMVARRLPTIMPRLELEESIEISKIYSIGHLLSEKEPLITKRPFRAPHHTVSAQALSGGGARPKPGEISLATGGILFLDELPEMDRQALEALRQPLEEHTITISRVRGTCCFPARFQLVAAMNPCLCGFYPDMERCTCTAAQRKRYLAKVSRPLLDRMDICVEAAAATYQDVFDAGENESSAVIRKRVEEARRIQKERFLGLGISCNGEMNGRQIRKYCVLRKEENEFMKEIFAQMQLGARTYDRILKVARTAADLDGASQIGHRHLGEAVSYMQAKGRYWR